ncbi:DUF3311 domain-containing protein [Acidocella sp.]|uniref:DUF3311 domain-containing protein n=1 Tax=Acidocella sp. TaxID=50710 RepID=UPI00263500E5|nr:DUF3311 domain-containing protein [Acidocella sp.]
MIRILLIVVVVLALDVPFYDRITPTLFGIPFFYWYQMALVPVSSFLIWLVYRAEAGKEAGQ